MEKRLYRSRRYRVFGGVAGGLATYFNLDPILMRVIFIVITLMHGLGILAYIILWIVLPEEPFEVAYPINNQTEGAMGSETGAEIVKEKGKASVVFGAILIAIGLLFLAERIIPSLCFVDLFPLIIVAIGGFLVWNSLKSRGEK